MRSVMTLLHRWAGLAIAVFLFITGVTGAIIAWRDALDEMLNPHLFYVQSTGPKISSLELARQIEQRHPQLMVRSLPLLAEDGKSLEFGVQPRINPETKRPFDLAFNQLFIDPVTGAEVGTRSLGSIGPITRENLMGFLYGLHFTLMVPAFWGTNMWGIWFLGIVAVIWMIDCFVGFYLTLPVRKSNKARAASVERQLGKGYWERWKPAWKIKTSGSAYRINFDIHRAFGLWVWVLLFFLALTSAVLNLNRDVVQPIIKVFSTLTPTPFDVLKPKLGDVTAPGIGYAELIEIAKADARIRGLDTTVGSVFYNTRFAIYGARFFGGARNTVWLVPAHQFFITTAMVHP